MITEEELERRHQEVIKRFPKGLTWHQFQLVTLESADEDDNGRVYPPSIVIAGNPLGQHSCLIRMSFDGLLEHHDDGSGRPWKHQPMRFRISEKGRQWLRSVKGMGIVDGHSEDRSGK